MTDRRVSTREFKAEAVRLATTGTESVSEVAKRLGIDVGSLGKMEARRRARRRYRHVWSKDDDLVVNESECSGSGASLPPSRERTAEDGTGDFKKSGSILREGVEVKYRFIDEHHSRWPIALQCEVLQVSRSGFYGWRKRPPSARRLRQYALLEEIRQVHSDSRTNYGSPRVHVELVARGQACNRKTVTKLMRNAGIRSRSRQRFRVQTTDSNHRRPVAENLLNRDFRPARAIQTWVADITYVPTDEGWLYLAAVLDLYSRKVVGWSMSTTIDSRLVVDALEMAVQRQRPPVGLIVHSDRGVQYASEHYQRTLARHGIISASRPPLPSCW